MGVDLHEFVASARSGGRLVVQPRMGFGDIPSMGKGLRAVASLDIATVGTLTVDSYTRVGDSETPALRLARGEDLNGFPLLTHGVDATRTMLESVGRTDFPVQLRHGTAEPTALIRRALAVGVDSTEGGPVSYCLPYSRVPLRVAVAAWAESCRILGEETETGHLESFGGCLLGQLCPPSLLIAVGLLECLFFRQHGVKSVSLSFTQGTSPAQDRAALRVLRSMAAVYLSDVRWHVVLYTYMGVFPRTRSGAERLIADSARLARDSGSERLIVKTVAEAWQIPSVEDNISALLLSARAAADPQCQVLPEEHPGDFEEIASEAESMVQAVLNLDADVGRALEKAFRRGLLDIPFCLHAANAGVTTTRLDDRGALVWADSGRLPVRRSRSTSRRTRAPLSSGELRSVLNVVAERYDRGVLPPDVGGGVRRPSRLGPSKAAR